MPHYGMAMGRLETTTTSNVVEARECLRPLLESALDTVRLYHYRCEATRSVAWRANKTKCPERVQPEVVTAKAVYVSVWCLLLLLLCT